MKKLKVYLELSSAAVASDLPSNHSARMIAIRTENQINLSPEEQPWVYYSSVTPDFFGTVGAVLLKGRTFLVTDSQAVIIVNETFAKKFWHAENPIGKFVQLSFDTTITAEVIGVVRDMKQQLNMDVEPEIYVSYSQQPEQFITVILRSKFSPATMAPILRKMIWTIDGSQPLLNIESMRDVIDRSTAIQRSTMYLLIFFAIIAFWLSIVGICSVISYSISQQTHEIGIRMAIGAEKSDVMRMILKKASAMIFSGVMIGVILSFVLNRTLENYIYGISRNDPITYISVSTMLIVAGLISAGIPGIRAAKIDPILALPGRIVLRVTRNSNHRLD